MKYYPIVQKDQHFTASPGSRQLPLFYMTDFSVLGFRVSDCRQAANILDRHAYPLRHASGGIEVALDAASRFRDVLELLTGNGLTCDIADIADDIYQG